jgi:hypothetical protein
VSNAALAAAAGLLLALTAVAAEPPLRDPMQPYRAVAGAEGPGGVPAPRFRLTAVLISPERRVAVVNGKAYGEGAHVDGVEITSIDARSIRLRDGDEELIVHLGSPRPAAPAVEGESAQ